MLEYQPTNSDKEYSLEYNEPTVSYEVYNKAALVISKTVTNGGSTSKDFTFNITMKTPDGSPLNGSYGYTGSSNGTITFAGCNQGYGNGMMINHGSGYPPLYGHLSKFRARVGQKVTRGEVIGEVGNTGKSTGPHLHYEVIVRGRNDNPSRYYYMDLTPEEYDRMIQIAENHGQVMD